MKYSQNIIVYHVLLVLVVLPAIGCGQSFISTEKVSGVVTFNGEPLANATVSFTPVQSGEGNASFGTTNAAGEYVLQTLLGDVDAGTTPGEYKVTINKGIEYDTGRKEVTPEGNTVPVKNAIEAIPKNYSDYNRTELKATVIKGNNVIPFELKGVLAQPPRS